ncbi:uncharacterized protein LOC127855390 [Dreissena polymorpha]|uniref:uncharacterized protein LOC127855390 n=1 Tax=Dreissena polymorpha TaxID=45954 RepID=UPI0022650545|nr:uncharacterized protein LOC127855390 [Dreissena polymorpha]
MANSVHIQCQESFLECQICIERFKDPRILPCQHSFCKSCLEKLITNDCLNEEKAILNRIFKCPTCRKKCKVRGEDNINFDDTWKAFPKSLTLANIIEEASNLQSAKTKSSTPMDKTKIRIRTIRDQQRKAKVSAFRRQNAFYSGESIDTNNFGRTIDEAILFDDQSNNMDQTRFSEHVRALNLQVNDKTNRHTVKRKEVATFNPYHTATRASIYYDHTFSQRTFNSAERSFGGMVSVNNLRRISASATNRNQSCLWRCVRAVQFVLGYMLYLIMFTLCFSPLLVMLNLIKDVKLPGIYKLTKSIFTGYTYVFIIFYYIRVLIILSWNEVSVFSAVLQFCLLYFIMWKLVIPCMFQGRICQREEFSFTNRICSILVLIENVHLAIAYSGIFYKAMHLNFKPLLWICLAYFGEFCVQLFFLPYIESSHYIDITFRGVASDLYVGISSTY